MKKRSSNVRKKQTGRRPPPGALPCGDPAKVLNHRERQAKRKQEFAFRTMCLKAAVAMVIIPGLCWLFLWYNRPEFLERILTIVVYVAGGYGWAHRNSKSNDERCA